jgi:5-methylcytosine-specific restriction endonuclease McrA
MFRPKAVKILARDAWNKERYGLAWDKIKTQVPLSGRTCSECGSKKNLQRHHNIPLSKGGQHSIANITVLCVDCHNKKHKHNIKPKRR